MDNIPNICPIRERRYEEIPVDQVKVINSRNRDKDQFEMNVESIEGVGLLKPIRVNDKFVERTGLYELICGEGRLLAHRKLGREKVLAEVVTCTRKKTPWTKADEKKSDLLKRLKEAEQQQDFYSGLYRQYTTNLLKLVIYVRTLLSNPHVKEYLQWAVVEASRDRSHSGRLCEGVKPRRGRIRERRPGQRRSPSLWQLDRSHPHGRD